MKATIRTRTVGHSFGTVGQVVVGEKVVAETRVYPYGFTGPAIASARDMAEKLGFRCLDWSEVV